MEQNYQELILQTNNDFLKGVKVHYEVSDDMAKERLEKIMLWYNLQPHFPKLDQDNPFFYRFLSMNKFDVEITKFKLENYFSVRAAMPEFYSGRDPLSDEIQTAFDYIQWVIVPRMTPERERICVLKLKKTQTAHLYDVVGAYKLFLLILDFRLMNDTSLTDRFVFDGTDCQLDHITRTPPAMIKKILYIVQNCFAGRIKGFHFINCPAYINGLITFSKTLVKKKLADKYHYHKTLEDLHKHIPAKYLPKELGGQEQTYDEIMDNIKKVFESDKLRKWFIEFENVKSDESKRLPENQWSMDDMLGIKGTFRKLDVD